MATKNESKDGKEEMKSACSSAVFGHLCRKCLRSRQILACDNQKIEIISIKCHSHDSHPAGHRNTTEQRKGEETDMDTGHIHRVVSK